MLENSILKCAKGQFLTVTALTAAEKIDENLAKRGFKGGNPMVGRITKQTTYKKVRICDYENLRDVIKEREIGKEARESWYDWEFNKFPYICKGKKNGKRYFVVKPLNGTTQYETKWFLDGVEVKLDEIKPYFKSSYFNKDEEPRMFTLQLEFITYIKQGNILYKK